MQMFVELFLVSAGTVVWAFLCCWFIQLMPAERTFPSFNTSRVFSSRVEWAAVFFVLPWLIYTLAVLLGGLLR